MNRFSFRFAFSMGLPGRTNWSLMPRWLAQLSRTRLVNSLPLSTRIISEDSVQRDQALEHADHARTGKRQRIRTQSRRV
jgi:hypothetical protein